MKTKVKRIRRLGIFLLFACALFPLYRFCEEKTAGFSIAKVAEAQSAKDLSYFPRDVLNQKFHYFSHGGQSFVFLSEDGGYVLKLLRKRFCPDFLLRYPLPAFVRRAVEKKRAYVERKWGRDAASYALSFDELKEECALLCVHLNKNGTEASVAIVDKLGITHTLDLDSCAFILQKKAEPILTHLEWQIGQKQSASAERTLDQIVALILLRLDKRIVDDDLHLDKNLGILDEKPIFIDIGRMRKESVEKSPEEKRAYLFALTARLRKWLHGEDPLLEKYLEACVEEYETRY